MDTASLVVSVLGLIISVTSLIMTLNDRSDE